MGKNQPGRDKKTFGGGVKSKNIPYLAKDASYMGVNSGQIYRTVTTDLCTSQYINDMPKIIRLSRAKVHLVLILSASKPKGR